MSAKVISLIILALLAVFATTGYFLAQRGKNAQEGTVIIKGLEREAFEAYKTAHSLSFGLEEEEKRFASFCHNLEIIAEHNAKNLSYELGVNSLAHYTREEFAALFLGFNGKARSNVIIEDEDDIDHLEATIDWVAKGAVTPVKNQGQCGSCWSFSTTGSLEGLNFISNGKLESFSEQQLVDCSGDFGNQGCNGGLMDDAFDYVQKNGITTEDAYPYTAAQGDCQSFKPVFNNTGHKDVPANSNLALISAISKQPVSVAIEADQSIFQFYTKGVISGSECGTQLDHGVLAVGYGVQNGKSYIKVKNSWGPNWGLNGFVLLAQAKGAGTCGINQAASYPTLSK